MECFVLFFLYVLHIVCVTFSFLAICQRWRYSQLPALPCAHVLQTLIPTLEHLSDPQGKPHRVFIPMFAAIRSQKETCSQYPDAIQRTDMPNVSGMRVK